MNYTNNTQKKFQAEDSQSLAKELEEEEEETSSSLEDEEKEHYEFWLWQMLNERK